MTRKGVGTRIFELDIAPTQASKETCLKKAQIKIPEHVTFAPIDFNQESLEKVLDNAGYKNQQMTLFIWEGVSYYLDVESVDATLAFASHASYPESTIAIDYTISISEETINQYHGVRELAQTMKQHHAGEGLMFSIDDGGTESFLQQRAENGCSLGQ